ncbi:MAG: MqnA/MqnD/SBP family protein, partial [Gaiellales bacterium]
MTNETLTPAVGESEDRDLVARELRLGRIDFLNMYPMHWALGVEPTVHGVPTDVNRAIIDGDIDVACMSSIEYARNADELMLLPSMCISAEGAVGSIFAISNVAFEDVTDVWLTPQSATSVVLLQLLLRLRGVRPNIHELVSSPAEVLDAGDRRAVLLIGDDALRSRGEPTLARFVFTDLGERWLAETGLPMVYAVWAVRKEAAERAPEAAAALDRLLVESVRQFAATEDAVDQAAVRFGIDSHATRSYYDRLCYDFAPNERKGLIRFLRMANEQDFLDVVPPSKFVEVAPTGGPEDGVPVSPGASLDPDVVRATYKRTVGSSRVFDETAEDDEHIERCLDLEADGRARDVDDVLHRALDGKRIDEVDALALLQTSRLMDVGQVAHALRLERTPRDEITFVVDRNINYTNYC